MRKAICMIFYLALFIASDGCIRRPVNECQEKLILKETQNRLEKQPELLWNLPPDIEKKFQSLLNQEDDFNEQKFNSALAEFISSVNQNYNIINKVVFRLKMLSNLRICIQGLKQL